MAVLKFSSKSPVLISSPICLQDRFREVGEVRWVTWEAHGRAQAARPLTPVCSSLLPLT